MAWHTLRRTDIKERPTQVLEGDSGFGGREFWDPGYLVKKGGCDLQVGAFCWSCGFLPCLMWRNLLEEYRVKAFKVLT